MTSIDIKECAAITLSGARCKRNATIDGYCKQHYDMYETPLVPDITSNILSDYIDYETLKELENEVKDLKINQERIEKIETKFLSGNLVIVTKIDSIIRKVEEYNSDNIKVEEINFDINRKKDGAIYTWYDDGVKKDESNYKNGLENGLQFEWWSNGNKRYIENYVNGKKEGMQYGWHPNGRKWFEENYKDDKPHGLSTHWESDGKIVSETNFENGLPIN